MPIYEYRCGACGEPHEALQKVSDSPLQVCPHCDEPALRKMVSAAAFRLKGGGWYETDFKKGDKKKNLAGDTVSHSGGDKGESKPSTSTESTEKKADRKPASQSVAAK